MHIDSNLGRNDITVFVILLARVYFGKRNHANVLLVRKSKYIYGRS